MRRERSLINHHWTKDCTWMMMMKSFLQSRYICLFAIASVTFSFLHLLSLFVNDRNKRGRGSVGPRMDETVPYLPTEKVDQLQKVRGDIEFAAYECLEEEWGVLEKSPEAALDVDQTIFVVVAEDVERSKTTVLWSARNFSSKKICLLYVHRPARPASCSENLLLLFLSDLTVLW
uniref:Uncharacterized protein n=1 Tax=Brassica campestris TaxID=3711 RepID=A0A3P5YCP9_BRACM|nr:unnamed protein product [Brassica rapa]